MPAEPPAASPPSRLQEALASQILRLLRDLGADVGHHLIEVDLCEHFGVSRTPVRGALRLLAERGIVEARTNRGFVLRRAPETIAPASPPSDLNEEDTALLVAIAQARISGALPESCSQQEIVRQLGSRVPVVVRVLRQMAELGLVERKPGHGWTFLPSIDSAVAQQESYQFRMVLEPAALLQAGFRLDRDWAARARAHHHSFRTKPWRDTSAVEFYEMNADFHESLVRASGNRYMLGAMQQQNRLRRILNYYWDYGVERVQESISEHLAILTAVEDGDGALAAALMRRHLGCAASSYPETGQPI
jgi:DNA-binding GntR family transcriptional regulator